MPPAASKTVRMLHDDKRPAPRQDYGHGEFDRITTVFTRQPPKADPGAVPRAFELAQSWEGVPRRDKACANPRCGIQFVAEGCP